jgi:hypothetical protein
VRGLEPRCLSCPGETLTLPLSLQGRGDPNGSLSIYRTQELITSWHRRRTKHSNKLASPSANRQTRHGGSLITQNIFRQLIWLAQCAGVAFVAFSTQAADSEIITFQESGAPSSENSSGLIGHWRKTTIGDTGPVDEHLVLHSDGTVENWTVTAYERREPVAGHWSVDGKILTLSFGGNDRSSPFTFYQGQLVFPNIPKRRGFWEKIE